MKKSSRVKEEERIEAALRGLLKLSENRRCINCNSLGPQYVCTTFLTFICTNCSGVHREFTHRVKSVSMAKFSAEEVSALQAAGNERARQIYLKGWDPQRNSYPDSSNLHRIREFIRHVYLDRKYAGEKRESPSRLISGEKEESYGSRKVGSYLSEARSPCYESRYAHSSSGRGYESRHVYPSRGRNDDTDFKFFHGDRRSPIHYRQNSRSGSYRKSPVRFEVVDDRFRDDTFGSGRRSYSNREYSAQNRSPDYQCSSSPLQVRSIKEILGENAPPLEVGKRLQEIEDNDADSSANNQKIAPSRSPRCVDGNQVEQKENNSESLINFVDDPKSTDATIAAPKTEEIILSIDAVNQFSNETPAKEKAQMTPKPNTLEFLLFELSGPFVAQSNDDAPATVSGSYVPTTEQMSTLPSSVSASATTSSTNTPAQPSEGNIPEASILQSAPVENLQMLPRIADAFTTTGSTYSPVQSSEASSPTVDASLASPLGLLSLPSSSGASTAASTANVLIDQSGGNMTGNGFSSAPHLAKIKTSANGIRDSPTVSASNVPVSPFHPSLSQVAFDINVVSVAKDPEVQKFDNMQPRQPLIHLAASGSSAAGQITTPIETPNNQPWVSSPVPYTQGPSGASVEQQSQIASITVPDTSSTKSSKRDELPADLFTASCMPPSSVPQWQTGPRNAVGFNMQYHPNTMLGPVYPSPEKSTNPFDFNSDTAAIPVQQFPSMASLQGVLPNLDLQRTSDIGAHSLGSMVAQSSSYAATIPSHSPSFPSSMSSRTFLGQQIHTNMIPPRLQEVDGFGNDRDVFDFSNIPQHPTGGHSVPTATNSFSSMGGNPFG